MGWVVSTTPSRFTPGKEIPWPLYKTLVEPQGQSGWVEKNRHRTDFEPQTFQPLASHTATLPPESGDIAALIFNLDTGEGAWSIPHPGRFTLGIEFRYRWNKRLVDPTVCLQVLEKRKIFTPGGIRTLKLLALSQLTIDAKGSRFRKLVCSLFLIVFPKQYVLVIYKQRKAIPLQTGPEGSRRLRLPDFKTIGTWKWKGCQPYVPAVFTSRKYSWYSFLLEAESTPGSQCGRKDYVNEKFQWHNRESIPRPSTSSQIVLKANNRKQLLKFFL
jgi:hypothetical protein